MQNWILRYVIYFKYFKKLYHYLKNFKFIYFNSEKIEYFLKNFILKLRNIKQI